MLILFCYITHGIIVIDCSITQRKLRELVGAVVLRKRWLAYHITSQKKRFARPTHSLTNAQAKNACHVVNMIL